MKPDKKTVHITEFLLGYSGAKPSEWRKNTRSQDARRLSSPLQTHLSEVNRFLFGGGVSVDVVDADPEDPRQTLLDEVNKKTGFLNCLDQVWERGATTGSVLVVYYPNPKFYYSLKIYDALEYEKTEDGGGFKIEYPDEDDKFVRLAVTPQAYEKYHKAKDPSETWVLEESIPHPYQDVPAQVIYNQKSIGSQSYYGLPEFDALALELTLEIMLQTLDAASSYRYFGHPLIVSAYPEETLDALAKRVQVLQGSMDQGMAETKSLTLQAVPPTHAGFLNSLKRDLAGHLGSAWIDPESPPQTSSIALKILHSSSIATSQKRWASYVDDGLEILYGKLLLAATYDGLYTASTPSDPESYNVNISRLQPYFSPTPQDQIAELSVSQTLIGLGIDPLVALQSYYSSLTEEEIQAKMTPT